VIHTNHLESLEYRRPPIVRLVRDQSMVGHRTIAFILHANEFWAPENVNITHHITIITILILLIILFIL
jgi:hypothetical protein